MKFFAELKATDNGFQQQPQTLILDATSITIPTKPTLSHPMKISVPIRTAEPKQTPSPIASSGSDTKPVATHASRLTDIDGVAAALDISRRHVQTLVRRKAIPVIRLGRRCTRFDLDSVMSAVKKFEITAVR
jgi:hypothetical protein